MIILAFLQNMWVRNPERVKAMIARETAESGEQEGEELRRRLMTYALFAGCVTGRRLRAAFGQDLCDDIIWEETTREIAGDPKTIFPADYEHIRNALSVHNPSVILTFGRIAHDAVLTVILKDAVLSALPLISSPHPAARQPDTIMKLRDSATRLKQLTK